MRSGTDSTRRMIASTVVRSLNTGMTTERSGLDGTARPVRSDCMESRNVPHLLIVAPNWLGDAVMALPAIADIARALPESIITVSARPAIAPLFTMVPAVTHVVGRYERTYDAVLLLPNSLQAAVTAWRTGIPERWGYRTDCRGSLLTRGVAVPAAEHLHQAAYYQYLATAL